MREIKWERDIERTGKVRSRERVRDQDIVRDIERAGKVMVTTSL